MRDHTIVVGYGTKGRAAVETLLGDGAEPTDIVVVDTDRANLDAASAAGAGDGHGQRDPVERPADRRGACRRPRWWWRRTATTPPSSSR